MRLTELGLLYLVVGLGAATALIIARRRATEPVDVALLISLWPLFAPFLLMRAQQPTTATDTIPAEIEIIAELLPNAATGRHLAERLERARLRVAEIDAVLATEPFDEDHIRRRLAELTARGEERAAESTLRRLHLLERLREFRARYQRQLDEVAELFAQLHVQAQVVRVVGGGDDAHALVSELMERVRGLDAILEVEESVAR